MADPDAPAWMLDDDVADLSADVGGDEEVVEEEEKFSMKPLAAPPSPEESPPALPAPENNRENGKEETPVTPASSGEESGKATGEEGERQPKEEQITLQDLLGLVLKIIS